MELSIVKKALPTACSAAFVLTALAHPQQPAGPPTGLPVDANAPIWAVTHIDVLPTRLDAVSVLNDYVRQAAHDPNVLHVELLQQLSAANHFTLVEELRNQAAYNAVVEAPYTRRFRALLAPVLASPYDERLHREVVGR